MTLLMGNSKGSGRVVSLIAACTLCVCLDIIAPIQAQHRAQSDPALESLHQIGKEVAQAVQIKDVTILLKYDRADLRSADEVSLKDKKSDLYCFLFDSSCISGKGRSVFDKLTTSHQLAVKVVDGGKSKSDGIRYATLLFYDEATISERSLRSRKFLCEQSMDKIASWTFKMLDGKWAAVTPLFDNETDMLCSPD